MNTRRIAAIAFLACAVGCAADPPVSSAEPTKRALLIGIDKYASPSVPPLSGAVRDVEAMKLALETRFEVPPENVTTLKDAEATRAGILSAIETRLIAPSQQGDIVILHYAGHGSQMPDDGNDEQDGWDETIVPHDARTTDVYDINDDEINGMLRELTRRTGNVTFIFDSCHSGTISRALVMGAQARQIDPDTRTPPPASARAIEGRDLKDGPSDLGSTGAGYVLISAARAHEKAYELGETGSRNGAFTYHLVEAMRGAASDATWRDIKEVVSAKVTASFSEQHPQIEGLRQDSALFGDAGAAPDPFVLVSPGTGGAVVSGGAAIGLYTGATFDVFAPWTKRFADATRTARIELTAVDSFHSEARVLEGSVAEHSRAAIVAIQPANFRLGVHIEHLDPPALASIRGALSGLPYVRLDASPAEAAVRIRQAPGGIEIVGREGTALSPAVPGSPDPTGKVVELVRKWARWHGLLALESSNPGLGVELKLHRVGDPPSAPPPSELEAGNDRVEVSVTNTSGTKLYVVMLVLGEDGSITSLPRPGQPDIALTGTIPHREVFRASLSDERTETIDVVKVIAATEPIPASLFDQSAARDAAAPPPPTQSPLALFLEDPEFRARDLEPVQVSAWTTRSAQLRVVKREVSAPQIAAHFATEESAARGRSLATSRNLDGNAGIAGLQNTLIVPRAGSRAPVANESIGKAFEAAYAVGRELGAERVEPLIDMEFPTPTTTRGGRSADDADDPRAEGDPLWSIRETNTEEAWRLIRDKKAAAVGEEARGIAIAHVDTGYRPHPEIWALAPDGRTVWHEAGWDYFGNDSDATDDLLSDQTLDNPAHGTGSGSAISSPTGSQTPNFLKGATGPGRGSRLVPLRVHRSVVHFRTANLVQSILDASGTDRTRVKVPTSFISLSMGGVPTYTLWKAVREAEARGYLIIAAAGNHVRTVVWPARFDSVLAVGATNYGCKPWKGTSRGKAVDVSAPGESVWRGIVDKGKDITSMGTGTTYGTATTAGVAALWYAYHQGDPAFTQLADSRSVARVFRHLVAKTAWRPSGTKPPNVQCDTNRWDSGDNGDGIVDAVALLKASLDDPQARALGPASQTGILDLPLFGSLYPDGTAPQIIQDDYRKLFPAGVADPGLFESEIMHHYTLDEDLAASLDQIAVRGDRGDAAFERARSILKARDLSPSLRTELS